MRIKQSLKELIISYIDFIEDSEYVLSIFQNQETKEIYRNLIVLLKSNNLEKIGSATLFLRDICLKGLLTIPEEITITFRELLPESGVFNALNENLYSKKIAVRSDTIYTIGKIGFRQNASLLVQAFAHYYENDPILIPNLLRELDWLTKNKIWNCVEKLIKHPEYIFRWSIVDLFTPYCGDLHYNKIVHFLTILSKDKNKFVANEANYHLQSKLLDKAKKNLNKSQFKQEVKRINSLESQATFLDITLGFDKYLYNNKLDDYSINELIKFITNNFDINGPKMDLKKAKELIEAIEIDLLDSVYVIAYTFEKGGRRLHLALTERLKRKCKKAKIWKSKELLTAFKNAKYGFDPMNAKSSGGKDGVFILSRKYQPRNEMMKKIFDRFLDKPDDLALKIAEESHVKLRDLSAVRLVSHHMRLLGVLKRGKKEDTIILVDFDNTK